VDEGVDPLLNPRYYSSSSTYFKSNLRL